MKALDAALQAWNQTWRAILGDKAALLLFFVSGIIYSFFYPLPYTGETVRRVPVAIVDQDNSALSRQLVRWAGAHPGLAVAGVTTRPEQARDWIWRGEAAGVMIIPEDFSRKLLAGRQPEVEVGGIGSYPLLNKVALNGLAEVVGTLSAGVELRRLGAATPSAAQAEARRQPVSVETLPLFNVREGYASYIVPGVVVLLMQQTFLLGIGLLFGSWTSEGRYPYAPRVAAYAGALAAFSLVVVLNAAWFFGFVFWFQDYPRGGNPAASLALTMLYSVCVAALGIYMGLFFRTRERSVQLLVASSMPVLFLAGLAWPAQALPLPLQGLRWLLPSTAAIEGFIASNQMGASLAEVSQEMLVLAGLTIAFVALGLRRWLRRQAHVG
jgi:ABC-2 type transport system permease protein